MSCFRVLEDPWWFFLKQSFLFLLVISNNLLLINRVTLRSRDIDARAKLKIFKVSKWGN